MSYPTKLTQQSFRVKPVLTAVFFACSVQHSGMLLAEYRDTNQNSLPTLEVTAEKRAAKLINIPMSVSAKSGAELDDANTQSITELSRDIPNVHMFSWGGRRDSNIFIRGIGPGLFTEPTVGFYVDGVNYLGNGMFDLEFLDIERVEILRGPQGTLYGGNSLAGVVNITTRKPGNTPEAKVQLQTHNKGMQSVKATVSAPIIKDELFWSLSFAGTNADGYTKSAYTDKKIDGREDYSMRSRVRWTPNDRFELNWIVDAEDFRGGSYSYAPLQDLKRNRYISTTVVDGRDNRNSLGSSIQLHWKGDSMDFTSVTGWRHWKSENYVDQFLPAYGFYDSLANDKQTQLTQEFRLSSNQEQRLKWIAGFYAYDTNAYSNSASNADYTGIVMGGPYTDRFNFKKDSYGHAFFGQVDYKLSDSFTVTGGLRRDDETRKVDASVDRQTMGATYDVDGKMSFSKWLPKGTISYTPDSSTHWYASIGKGYRAGGYDTLYLDQTKPSFKPEESINYEIGLKKKFLDERAEFSSSVFLIDIKDQQVQRIIPSISAFNILTDNAGKGRSQGFETELKLMPAQGWLIAAGAGYTHTEFKEYQYDANTDYSGNRLPFAPQFNANLGLQHRRPINDNVNLFARADVQYIGTHYFDAANTHKQDGYALVNFKIGLEGERWDAYLWAKNLTDKFYSTVITQQGPTPLAALGAPRFVGLTLNLHY